jgi:hypothetical protein
MCYFTFTVEEGSNAFLRNSGNDLSNFTLPLPEDLNLQGNLWQLI